MFSRRLTYWKILLLCFICALLGGIIGWLIPLNSPLSLQQAVSYRGATVFQSSAAFQFIDPLLACDIGSETDFPELAPLKGSIANLINQKIHTEYAQNISVYFRLLRSARWFEINGTETYAPASLLKIFVMMAYYEEADETDNPALLQEQVAFQGSATDTNDIAGGQIIHLTNGKLYTIDQIINQMIIYSDNDAYDTLVRHFDSTTLGVFETIFSDLNIPSPVNQNEHSLNFLSPEEYAMVFRVLFGSTYLSDRYSEKALRLLSRATYTSGLVAGIPPDTVVAHKYGVTTITTASSAVKELHDCGIVYYPNHPYLLCVMTKGQNFATMQESIQGISSTTYQWLKTFVSTSSPTNTTSSIVRP